MSADTPIAERAARSDPDAAHAARGGEAPGGFQEELQKLLAFAGHYAEVRTRQARAVLRRVVLGAILAVVVGFAALVALCISVWLLLSGLAAGIAETAQIPLWAGRAVLGLAVLALGGVGAAIWIVSSRARILRSLVRDFERRKTEQRTAFGKDIEDVARNPDSV